MYEAIFQTTDRPFRATPDERFYFPFDSVEQARQTLARVVRRAEGPAMVMGGSGLGKTMLAQVVANDLGDLFDVVRLYATRLSSRRALLQSILFELQLPYRDLSEGELRLSLMNRMERSPEYAPSGLLLIVDEAHTLPIKLLEELRLITNFSRSGEPRARLILVGSLALEDIFARPQLDSFNQRLAARCYLQPMNRQQTHSFIAHQLRCIGAEPNEVITRDAMDAVYDASEGIPRLANQVMDHSLVLAITNGQSPISAALVEEAWSDLQQLPAPWHGTPERSPAAPIEFGSLDESEMMDESEAEVELKLPEGTRIESLPETMPTYQFVELKVEQVAPSSSGVPSAGVASAPARFQEIASVRDGYSFFDDFKDIGQLDRWDFDLPSIPTERSTHAPTDLVFTQVEESIPAAITEPAWAVEADNGYFPARSEKLEEVAVGKTDEYAAEPNELGMLVIHEDQSGSPTPMPNLRDFVANQWDFSFADWSTGLVAQATAERDPIQESRPEGDGISHGEYPSLAASTKETETIPQTFPIPRLVQSHDPFGADFDEEFAIESPSLGIWASKPIVATVEPPPTPGIELREQEALDQITEMRRSLESFQSAAEVQPELVFQSMNCPLPVASDHSHIWQVDTSHPPTHAEEAVHEEIEDLISQLNFSAFSMDPESVEQISIDYMRVAAPAPMQIFDSPQTHNDPPIYSMHESAHEPAVCCFDDDRELLVIEEDIPLSMKLSSVPTAPTRTEVQSYNQLFTKLRS